MSAFEIGRYERKYVVTGDDGGGGPPICLRLHDSRSLHGPVEAAGLPGPLALSRRPAFALYRQTAEGLKNRYKLRIRFYDESESSPAFLEIKRRVSLTMYKQRATVSKRAAESLLCGQMLAPGDLLSPRDDSIAALGEFCTPRSSECQRRGVCFLLAGSLRTAACRRCPGDVRSAHCQPPYDPRARPALVRASEVVSGNYAVLELKYMGRAPGWMKDLVRSCRILRGSPIRNMSFS